MITYTEKYGDLWKIFITDVYFSNSEKAIKMSKKRMIKLAELFAGYLSGLKEELEIAG